ncbi:restriction endonuclease [Quadrisphaera setariae]|uniref:restriction endonuclease n=1 Tax=Quadrisphaera setariae TaxID=2593304 RepID=UPI00164F3AEE|nr:restriction endonuclease [Quadrisphaera setariae]
MVSKESLRGYVMEEALARLLHTAGYQLVTQVEDDAEGLVRKGNGLAVRGRGGDHQADVLALLTAVVPFGYRLRLFVEAKHRADKVGLPAVRSSYAVLADVNQFVPGSGRRRYDHQSVFFSTGGYSTDAQRFADAHGISLQDFTGKAWQLLRHGVETTADALGTILVSAGRSVPLPWARQLLREALGTPTSTGPVQPLPPLQPDQRVLAAAQSRLAQGLVSLEQVEALVDAFSSLADLHERSLLIAHTSGRMMLVIRPDGDADLAALSALAQESRTREVPSLYAFDPVSADPLDGGDWVFSSQDPTRPFHLRVGVPALLEHSLLTTAGAPLTEDGRRERLTFFWNGQPITLVYRLADPPGVDANGQQMALRCVSVEPAVAIPPAALLPEPAPADDGEQVVAPSSASSPPASEPLPGAEPPEHADAGDGHREVDEDHLDADQDHDDEEHDDGDDEDASSWDVDDVKLVLYELADDARRLSSAHEALTVMHAAARAGGRLKRDDVRTLLGDQPGTAFNSRSGALTRVVNRLRSRGDIAATGARPLQSVVRLRFLTGRRAVVAVRVHPEFIEQVLATPPGRSSVTAP